MPRTAQFGQLLVNKSLPTELRDYTRVLDKDGLDDLLRKVADQHPDKYREITHALNQIGRQAAYMTGGNTFGLEHLRMSPLAKQHRAELSAKMQALLDDDNISDDDRESQILGLVNALAAKQGPEIFDEAIAAGNPLAHQVQSGARGNKTQLASLLASDLLYTDHRNRTVPVPVLHGYGQGLRPDEYWAGTYGARKGVLATKFATRDAGFLSKQLNQIVHRFVVTAHDDDRTDGHLRGLPVSIDDADNEGALLARDTGPYKRNTRLTPKVIRQLKQMGHQRLLVRSAAVGGPRDGGVFARDVGVRERGNLPTIGENVGMAAAQAMSEPLSQAQLGAKHSGGVVGAEKAVSGFEAINQQIQVPRTFQGGATHAEHDGFVDRIEPAPAGGQYVIIAGEKHYVPPSAKLKVQRGDRIEAGDVLTDGWPNVQTITQHKGIGEARRAFLDSYIAANKSAGIKVHRRNAELLARGLINHVRLTDEVADGVPDDIVPYSVLEHNYEPRMGFQPLKPKAAVGKYLERPYLHHTIGTKIRPSMLKDFEEFGIDSVDVHDEPPPFNQIMIRGMNNLQHDPDWMTRMFGSGLKGSLLDAAHRGGESDAHGTSFVPALANPIHFGQQGKIKPPLKPSPLLGGDTL